VVAGNETTQILSEDCIATVRAASITKGGYPLPGRTCREPLKELWQFGNERWLLAGIDLWHQQPSGAWSHTATLPNADQVMLPLHLDDYGLALVVPYRQPTRKSYQASVSYELRLIAGKKWPRMPKPALAKAPPGHAFDNFMGACETTTRLAAPRAFHVTKDHRVMVFGTECDRTSNVLSAVVEEWAFDSADSTIRNLPFREHEALVAAKVRDDDDIWLASTRSLLHFDGHSWAEVAGPGGMSGIFDLSLSPKGTIWLLTTDNRVWRKRSGAAWLEQTTAPVRLAERLFADGEDDVWLSTGPALLSTRPLAESDLCEASCQDFWQQEGRLRRLPVGD